MPCQINSINLCGGEFEGLSEICEQLNNVVSPLTCWWNRRKQNYL